MKPDTLQVQPAAFLQRVRWTQGLVIVLLLSNLLFQALLLTTWIPTAQDPQLALLLSWVEMAQMFAVLAIAGFVVLWCRRHPRADVLFPMALLNALGLLFCTLGDGVNKNFNEQYFTYDAIIRHSYLIDSIYCFFPGYALMISAMLSAVRLRITPRHWLLPLVLAIPIGLLAWMDLRQPGMSQQALWLMAAYSCLISAVGLVAWPLLRAYGWAILGWVAVGAVLATLADALIGRWWIGNEDYYPAVRYVNWMLYYSSQLALVLLPLRVALALPRKPA